MRHGGRRQDTVGIGDVTAPVHSLDVGNLLRTVRARKDGQCAGEQQAKDRYFSHNLGTKIAKSRAAAKPNRM